MEHQCSKCPNPRRPGQRYCAACHAAYMRAHRPTYAQMSVEARHKMRVRHRTLRQQYRFVRPKGPCARCGHPNAVNHHPDYDQPDVVVRLCRPCHRRVHQQADVSRE